VDTWHNLRLFLASVAIETFPCYKNIEVCFLGKNLEMFSFSREYFPYSLHDKFLLRYKTLQYLTYSLLNRPTCNLSLWGLRSGGSSDETQKSGWDIVNCPKVCKNVSEDLFNTSGLQLEGLMKNQFCVHYLRIFVETSSVTYAWTLFDEQVTP